MRRNLQGAIVVQTGASSGIGRAAALAFAARGSNVVLAARGPEPLEEVAARCREKQVKALAVPTDISDESQVAALAGRALQEFGRIDVWVNCAAVVSFGRFLDVPPEAFRRVLETNLMGTVHGSRAALAHFSQRSGGVLINVASVLGKEGIPYLSSYVASKEAIVGFDACLREELRHTGIYVCSVLPASINTPIWQHGANYTGRAVKPVPPIYEPEQVAETIVACARRPRRVTYVGLAGPIITTCHKISPTIYEEIAGPVVERVLFQGSKPAEISEGNIFQPSREPMAERGGWPAHGPLVDRVGILSAAAGVAGIAGWWWARRARKRLPRTLWRMARRAVRRAA